MSGWKEYKLRELTLVKGGKLLPKGELFVHVETPHPYIRVTDMRAKWIRRNNLMFVEPHIQKSISRYIVNSGDVILSIVGSIGFVSRISDELDEANLTKNCVKFAPINSALSLNYLYYYLKSPLRQEEIKKRDVGAVQPKPPIYNINDINILLPLIEKQKLIAGILSSLDDKIDLLNRKNATLEAMAETLFRQHFIENSNEEWEEKKLSDLIVLKYGENHKSLLDGKTPVYGSGGLRRYAEKALYDQESVLIPRKGTLNNVVYVCDLLWTVDTIFHIEIKQSNIAKFGFYLTNDFDLTSINVGSAISSMTTDVLNNIPLQTPTPNDFEDFEYKFSDLYIKIRSNNNQILTLIKLRDTLLPKLMNNEIKI